MSLPITICGVLPSLRRSAGLNDGGMERRGKNFGVCGLYWAARFVDTLAALINNHST